MAVTPFLTGDQLTQARMATFTNQIDAADALAAPLASPSLTGTPLSTTPAYGDSSTKIATTAFVGNNMRGLAEGAGPCLTGGLFSTIPRHYVPSFGAQAAPASGVLRLCMILLPKGASCTNIRWCAATSGGSGLVNQWFGLFDNNLNKLALTADDLTTAWAANTNKTLTITGGPFVTTYAGMYYLGIMINGTCPTLVGNSSTANANVDGPPYICGDSTTGLTNPASCPSTVAALGVTAATNARRIYAEIG